MNQDEDWELSLWESKVCLGGSGLSGSKGGGV